MWPTWGPPGSWRPQVGPTLAPWILLSEIWGNEISWDLRFKMHFRRMFYISTVPWLCAHKDYSDIIMSVMVSQTTSLMIVYSTVYSGADQRKHESSTSLAFVRGIHRWPLDSPHKGPVTQKMFPFDDVIMKHPKFHTHRWAMGCMLWVLCIMWRKWPFFFWENNHVIFEKMILLPQRKLPYWKNNHAIWEKISMLYWRK